MIAVGPGAPNKDGNVVPTQVKAGDRVLLPGWGGNSIKVGEEVSLSSDGCVVPLLIEFCRSTFCSRIRRSSQRLRSDRTARP